MAVFTPKPIVLSSINNGNKYNNGDSIQANAINSPIEAAAYAQDLSERAFKFAENVRGDIDYNSKRLDNLEARLSDDVFITDSEVTAEKIVPENVAPYAKIVAVGGMTYRDEATNTLKNAKVTALKSSSELFHIDSFLYSHTDIGPSSNNRAISGFIPFKNPMYVKANHIPEGFMYEIEYYSAKEYSASAQLGYSGWFTDTNTRIANQWVDGVNYIAILIGTNSGGVVTREVIEAFDLHVSYDPSFNDIIDTFTIPEVVQALDGYGFGTESIQNIIRYENEKVEFLNYCEELIFDGDNINTSYIGSANGYHFFSIPLPYYGIEGAYNTFAVVSNEFETDFDAQPGYAYATNEGFTAILCFPNDQTLDTVEKVNTWAKERYASGNPIKFVIGAKTPTITDITHLMPADNLIKVQQGGSIVPVNEHGFAAPTIIKYQKRS